MPALKFRHYLYIENITTNSKAFQLWCESLLKAGVHLKAVFQLGIKMISAQYSSNNGKISVWTNLGKHLFFVWLFVSGAKTGTRCIMRLDELSFEIRLQRRTKRDSSSRRIIRLVSVFKLKTHNQTNYKCLPNLRPDG